MSAAALAHLYEQHRGPVVGALARRCPWVAPVDRESLYHDAYTAMLERERIGTLEPERMHPRELRAYLVKSAIHKALDERKSAERRLTVPLDLASHDRADGGPALDEAAIRAFDAATVRELVDELPARGQAVLRLRFLHELEPTEIQSLLRISRRAYRKELERAVRQIASRYELVRSGRWHEMRRSLVLAYVAGVTGPRRTRMARQHLAACPDCALRAVELRRAAERVAAVVPLPVAAADYAPLQRIIEAATGAQSSVSELGSGAKRRARQPCSPGLGSDTVRGRSAGRHGRRHRWMPRARGRRHLHRGRGAARRHRGPARGRGAAPEPSRQQAGAPTA